MVTAAARTRLNLGTHDGGVWVHLVEDGLVRPVAITPDGRECGLGLLGPGEAFVLPEAMGGAVAGVDPGPSIGFYVEAVRDTRCLSAARAHLPALAQADPRLAAQFLLALSGRVADLGLLSASLVLENGAERVHRLLRQLARRHGVPDAGGHRLRVRQQDVASMTGLCRETVNAALRELTRAGAVRCGRQSVWVPLPPGGAAEQGWGQAGPLAPGP